MITNEDTLFRPAPPTILPVPPAATSPSTSTAQRAASCTGYMITDYDGLSALTQDAQVLYSWPTPSMLLLGVDPISMLVFFSGAHSMQIYAYDLTRRIWVEDPEQVDPDFPRYSFEDTGSFGAASPDQVCPVPRAMPCVVDLDTGCRHHFREARPPAPSSRLSA